MVRELEKSRTRLEELLRMNADRNEIQAVQDHMNDLMYKEELMWLQRSRIDWLREGDRNTKFFHARAIWRARKNMINKLEDVQGTVHMRSERWGLQPLVILKTTSRLTPHLIPLPSQACSVLWSPAR